MSEPNYPFVRFEHPPSHQVWRDAKGVRHEEYKKGEIEVRVDGTESDIAHIKDCIFNRHFRPLAVGNFPDAPIFNRIKQVVDVATHNPAAVEALVKT